MASASKPPKQRGTESPKKSPVRRSSIVVSLSRPPTSLSVEDADRSGAISLALLSKFLMFNAVEDFGCFDVRGSIVHQRYGRSSRTGKSGLVERPAAAEDPKL